MDEADVALVPGDITMDSPNDAATRQHRDNGATQGRMADRRRRRFKRQSTSFRDDASDPDTKVTEISSDPPGSSNNGVFHPASRPGGHDYRSINVKDTRCHSQDSEYSYRQPSPRTHHRHRRPRYLSEADSSSHSDSRSSRRWHACFPKCRKRRRKADGDAELTEDDLREIRALKEPRRKQCMRACFNFLYVLLAIIAIVVTYSMIQDLVTAMKNPVRSIHYKRMQTYNAPGIAVYPGGAKFLACGHYYNNVVTSKVRLSQLDLVNRNCSYRRLLYEDPHYPGIKRDVLVLRGPTSFVEREAIFIHFELEDITRDFFTVSYFVFPEWDNFNGSTEPEQVRQILDYHRYVPTFALSAGLRMWIKLIMSEQYLLDDTKNTDFRVEYSVVRHWDSRPEGERSKHLFFIFFEWKNDLIEQSYLIYTTTPWSIGAGLCGVFLTLHRGYQLAQTSYKRMQKDKRRRTIRKQTIRELKRQKSEAHSSCHEAEV